MGRLFVYSHSQGDALGYELVGLSALFNPERKRAHPFNPCYLCSKKTKAQASLSVLSVLSVFEKTKAQATILCFTKIKTLREASQPRYPESHYVS